jgi:hypothetical protein
MAKNKRFVWIAVLAFVSGGLVGGVTMAALARAASKDFLWHTRMLYEAEEMARAEYAEETGDLEEAVRHHRNLLDDAFNGGLCVFGRSETSWDLYFPLRGYAYLRETGRRDGKSDAQGVESYHRQEIARLLKLMGREDESRGEFTAAMRLARNAGAVYEDWVPRKIDLSTGAGAVRLKDICTTLGRKRFEPRPTRASPLGTKAAGSAGTDAGVTPEPAIAPRQ